LEKEIMSNFSDTYFKRFVSEKRFINEMPNNDLFLTVVIPSFNEPNLCNSLYSLRNCNLPKKSVEVIVVINSPENCTKSELDINRRSFEDAISFSKVHSDNKLKFHILNLENLPKKFAGVGLARKTGMDEALRRFGSLVRPEGLIAAFDADASVKENYFTEIERYFYDNPNRNACSVHFEHPIEGNEFTDGDYKRIVNYELHLRYLNESLRYTGFPYAYHTIGSAFVIRAYIYAKQGGMNRKKAGEDFYFLHKIIPLGNYGEINNTAVIPSPRMSDRVPFGTGAAVKKMSEINSYEFTTYDTSVFEILKSFFENIEHFIESNQITNFHESLQKFLLMNQFSDDLDTIRKHSPNKEIFTKRFFDWFNAFRIIKFLNFAHIDYFKKKTVFSQALELANKYFSVNFNDKSEKELLIFYRDIQKRSTF